MAEFAGSEAGDIRDDSDVDVDGLLELDSKGEVVRGNYGEVRISEFQGFIHYIWCTFRGYPGTYPGMVTVGVSGYLPE